MIAIIAMIMMVAVIVARLPADAEVHAARGRMGSIVLYPILSYPSLLC